MYYNQGTFVKTPSSRSGNFFRKEKKLNYNSWAGREPPPPGFVKINVDGSAKGSPDASALGGCCRDVSGQWIFGFTQQLGVGHAIWAELFAIWKAKELAWSRGYRRVIIEIHSLLALQKIMNDSTEPNALSHLINRCKAYLQKGIGPAR
ncbi:hypothetical protein SLEP1_g26531 [Rubroshorea leprosula]|uniref:RNase H type-1 domain-containing protein n=1 Tax=Rubroshorea leprosula TaxID=152421 RepID=A0AAV5JYJ5_9ROSI|nr:hypothetical protein SLEP1_g26531 [Rubroshorea leprosula]